MKKIILTQSAFLMFFLSGYTQSWDLAGNAGTNPASNFLGTTDARPMVFRVNNKRAGYIDYDTTKGNTSFGYRALFSNSGVLNTAFGGQALFSNTTGNSNTAIGFAALYSNKKGIHNVAIGQRALYSNTDGHRNIAIGYEALNLNTTGITSTALGDGALSFNTTGYSNVAVGFDALLHNTTGFYNTACGNNTLLNNTIGKRNTAVGWSAGSKSDSNSNCTFVGYDANQVVSSDFTNSMALGYTARITASNQVRVGNSSITSIGGYVGWTDLPSDVRFKKNIKENVPGLAFINQLRPVTYTMDVTKLNHFLGREKGNETNSTEDIMVPEKKSEAEALIKKGIEEKEKIVRTGFVAQEVEAVAKRIGYDFSGVDKPQNENSLYGLRYAEFVVPLVKAVQELSKLNDEKDAKINAQQKVNENLQKQIDELEAIVSGNQTGTMKNDKAATIGINNASLEQNMPNPFSSATTIGYSLPKKFTTAQIIITDKSGKMLKQITVSGAGKGIINVDTAALISGTYTYSLIVDGRLISSRQMICGK